MSCAQVHGFEWVGDNSAYDANQPRHRSSEVISTANSEKLDRALIFLTVVPSL